MTPRQIELIEESWDFVITNTTEAGQLFYERLFHESPDLRPLFKGEIREQERKLISLITFAVSKLRNLDEIVEDVRALGTRHKQYGVKDEYYNNVATALLWTLEQGLGTKWTEEVKQAWIAVYTTLADVMTKAPATRA
ncbi:MAG: hemin receptor [Cytophagia bacterium]|nr:hemin receptor [Cytophagia bacterium]